MIDAEKALRIVRSSPLMAYDTETKGLKYTDDVCGYVITDPDVSLYVPVRHEAGGNILGVDEFEKELADAFRERNRHGGLTVGHNLSFDISRSYRHGIELNRQLEDTQVNEALINDIEPTGFSLDASAKRYSHRGVTVKLGSDLYVELANRFGGVPDRKQMANFWRLAGDNEYAVDYAVGDGVTTLQLRNAQQELLDEGVDGKSLRAVHALECKLIWILGKMKHRGLKIDAAYAEQVMTNLEKSIKEAKELLPIGLNVNSPKELEAMFRAAGFTDFAQTAQGKPSFKETWLERNELGNKVLDLRKLAKARDSFITPLVETHNYDGYVHPTLNQTRGDDGGAKGGRFSCSDPNLQAFPKRNKVIGKVVRPLVISEREFIGEADFSQQEPRLFAHYSEEPELVRGYNSIPPTDMHDLASKILDMPRDDAKRLGMGMLTTMQPKTLQAHMGGEESGWTLRMAEAAHRAFLTDAFPKIGDFQQMATKAFRQRGYIRTVLGRISYLDDRRFAYRGTSRVIQGTAGDHGKTTLVRAFEFTEAAGTIDILLPIHDSTVFQMDGGDKAMQDLKEMVRLMEDVQTPPFNFIVPIPMEVQIGRNWAEASYGAKIKTVSEWKV